MDVDLSKCKLLSEYCQGVQTIHTCLKIAIFRIVTLILLFVLNDQTERSCQKQGYSTYDQCVDRNIIKEGFKHKT